MTPGARVQAAIEILDRVLAGAPAEAELTPWARASRFAGSGDRAAVRDLVFDSLRRRRSRAALGGSDSGRGLMIGMCRDNGLDPDSLFTGEGHAPAALSAAERNHQPPAVDGIRDLPDWLADRLSADLGPAFPAVAAALRDRAPVWLRVNVARATPAAATARLAQDGIEVSAWPGLASALRVEAGARKVAGSAAYRDGLVELQDLSAQLSCAAMQVTPGERVLDWCAGGGGKALALAAVGAKVTAHDADPARMRDLPARARRAGARIEMAPPSSSTGQYGLVVTDVPCSGSGTWRRTPDAKWRLTPADLDRLTEIQLAILRDAADHVRPGGRLGYMTCSLLRVENEDRIARFLLDRPDFRLQHTETLTPETASDGFFHALMLRD
ncbi:RsmB/NOP family class I SAM-dependent RNA methyltransferase [uncultured Paracoccus sp.]|uniref:RsmB/NOP family class I SAM-dependent RNA methyltransferase n=1 Tax=uncultured Paracoccus sp. TaxID=189685 RepID=UPI002635B3E9|nr:RsmB/NOP family class I SAM-dependent RNA methyltransferase [uncultured Paracoccus sp.]